MIAAIMGIFSFLIFGIYDINQVKWKNKWLKSLFFIGLAILIASTIWLLVASSVFAEGTGWQITILVISGGFFLLLLYSLFIAVPFNETYIAKKDDNFKKVCDVGMYGLCRHPGFLWFTLAYIMLALATQYTAAAYAVAVFIICNFLYVLLQDFWTFPRIFEDYEEYKKKVPFLLPNVNSIKNSLADIKKKGIVS